MRVAITRAVSPAIGQCELSYVQRQRIDASLAAAQHDQYERRLAAHGCKVIRIADAVERFRPLRRIEPPATLDGGDVLAIGGMLYVGLSQRTNMAAIEQLNTLPSPAASR